MKLKTGFVLREVADQYVVLAVGIRAREFKDVIALNETAAFLWRNLKTEISEEELTNLLFKEYEVEWKEAETTVKDFVETLKIEGVLEDA